MAVCKWQRLSLGLIVMMCISTILLAQKTLEDMRTSFAHPPDDCRIMMRWWWFGPAITKPELRRELERMKAAGIGGVEIATLYPQALDDPTTGFHNVPYLSDEYIDDLHFAAEEARRLGLRVDVTLGSGWPFGGPHIPVTQAAGELRVEFVDVPAGVISIALPSLESGEAMLQAFIVPGKASSRDLSGARPATKITAGRLIFDSPTTSERTVLFFIASRTGMVVKRPAVGAAGFVLDHYDPQATTTHLQTVGNRLLQAFGENPPYAVFSDSLEDYGSDWTPKLLEEFKQRRGYDITPYLPALVGDIGPSTAAIRHDWGRTLTELADQNFLRPMQAWAHEHHTLLRSQSYGFPPVNLASNQYEDLPEGEGKANTEMWRQFSDTRWASSAGHLFEHNVISSETWTWLHSPAFRATPLDLKAEADLHFLQGINQLVGHGWPYSPASAVEPGWHMYAAAALDDHNPWFGVMPELTAYLQRVSFALRLGEPVNDVAVLLPDDDIWASFKARVRAAKPPTSAAGFDETGSNVTIDESMHNFLSDRILPEIIDAGFDPDFIDSDSIDAVGIPYKALVLPSIDRLPLATYRKVQAFARHGGIVIATRRLPATAPGLLHSEADSKEIQQLSRVLFESDGSYGQFVPNEDQLGKTLREHLRADFVSLPALSVVGFVHRKLKDGDLYFIANTSNQSVSFRAQFRGSAARAEYWDPMSGKIGAVADPMNTQLELLPYESRIFMFSNNILPTAGLKRNISTRSWDLSHDWKVTFPGGEAVQMHDLHSWTDDPSLTFFSGSAEYNKTIAVPAKSLQSRFAFRLNFGAGTPVDKPHPTPRFNMRAYLESPLREVAEVYVNGKFAGCAWHPPYEVDLTSFLKAGSNQLRIVVSNTAINEMAGQSPQDYQLLYDRYGLLFVPQDMDHLQPLPSGILGPVVLEEIDSRH